jgi:hypothetical protein
MVRAPEEPQQVRVDFADVGRNAPIETVAGHATGRRLRLRRHDPREPYLAGDVKIIHRRIVAP